MKIFILCFLCVTTMSLYPQILITEVMFDPENSEYVEIYNNSENIYSLSSLYFAIKNDSNFRLYQLSQDKTMLLLPYKYMVITKDVQNLLVNYDICADADLCEATNIPSLNNQQGNVFIVDKDTIVFDGMYYSQKMHYPLLLSTKGVSLERVSMSKNAEDSDNWHSASSMVGYCSPGCENSQMQNDTKVKKNIKLSHNSFSPNGDGREDLLGIAYKFDEAGYMCSIRVFDSQGIQVKFLVNNKLLDTEGTIYWDGFSDNKNLCRAGFYEIVVDVFLLSGKLKRFKESVALGS